MTILVVDDNHDAADALADLVRLFGYQARVAYDGPAGLKAAADRKPDIALLDIGLPVMDGYELAQEPQELYGDRPLKLVAVTGYGQPSDQQRTKASGFERHLVKPVDPGALEKGLREITATLHAAHGA